MQADQRRSFMTAIFVFAVALLTATRTSGFETIRTVQLLLLLLAGMGAGMALMILRFSMKMKK